MKYPVPTEPGLYLARDPRYTWWNWVIWVLGEPPFLRAEGWDFSNSSVWKEVMREKTLVWGPKIEEPEVDKADVAK